MSANKLLGQILSPEKGGFQQLQRSAKGGIIYTQDFHDRTYGIGCDPLMHFATVQAAMIHDVAHLGVTNAQLAKRNREMAALYNGRSIAEQHSLALSLHLFADSKYSELRDALLGNDTNETKRYYQLMTSAVLATDIADKDLKEVRQRRWDNAFKDEENSKQAKETFYLDSFYLAELSRLDWHFRIMSKWAWVVWLVLLVFTYNVSELEVLSGVEQKAAAVAFTLLACSCVFKLSPYFSALSEYHSEPVSGVVIGVITIESIALITNGTSRE